MKKGLYFIGILPPYAIAERVQEVKKEFVERYESKEAYKRPAHFTLQIPFKIPADFEENLIRHLEEFSSKQQPFTAQLAGFGHFRDDVIFIDLEDSTAMKMLRNNLITYLQQEAGFTDKMIGRKSFTPHMTVAYRDLTSENFQKAWEEFKDRSFDFSFEVKSIYLLKHDYTKWQPHREFNFLNE